MSVYLELFLVFLKIGAVSFGGGYGMISLIQQEVLSRGWLTADELWNLIAIAESTPGPIAVNIATFVGSGQGGVLGSLIATLGIVTPAFIIILIVATVFKNFAKNKYVKAAFEGITPVIWGLVISTGLLLIVQCFYANYKDFSVSGAFNFHALIIFGIVIATLVIYRLIRKKSMPPIAIILVSAISGMIYYLPL